MTRYQRARVTRRGFLQVAAVTLSTPFVLAACGKQSAPIGTPQPSAAVAVLPTETVSAMPEASTPASAPPSPMQTLTPTPACGDEHDEPTLEQTEGPFFTPDSPERASLLEAGLPGETIIVQGTVLTTDCKPVAGALVDFWHADDAGVYDNVGYRCRGHQFADEAGRYRLETVVPGLYPGRTRHFHVKVQAPNQPVLTTQLYFPGEAENERDGIFDPALLMAIQDGAGSKTATFDFVLLT